MGAARALGGATSAGRPVAPSPALRPPPRTAHTSAARPPARPRPTGDIVVPGIFLALLLRFDALTALRSGGFRLAGHAAPVKPGGGGALDDPVLLAGADFARPLFNTGLLAYVLGLVATVAVMVLFDHAQPALLYLVPAVLLAAVGASLALGRFRALMVDYADEQYSAEFVRGGARGDDARKGEPAPSAPPPPAAAAGGGDAADGAASSGGAKQGAVRRRVGGKQGK